MIFQFLLLLIERQGQVVPKTDVMDNLWRDKKPTDEALRALVKKTREALGDNARSPIFIKTIPTKGYLLIPSVEIRSTVAQSWLRKHKTYIASAGLFVTMVGCALIYWFVSAHDISKSKKLAIEIKTKILADIIGDVNAYYTNNGLINIVFHERENGFGNSVLVQRLDANEQLMLSFNEAISRDIWLASSYDNLLVMRRDNGGFYQVNVNANWQSPSIFKFDFPIPNKERIVGLNHNASIAYLFNESELSLSQFDIDNGEQSQPNAFISLSSALARDLNNREENTQLSPSKNDSSLALSAEQPKTKVRIITASENRNKAVWIEMNRAGRVIDTKLVFYSSFEKGEPLSTLHLDDTTLSNVVWDSQGTRLSFINDNGELFSYQIAQERVTSWRLGGVKLNNLFADCGRGCFVVARQQGAPKLVYTHANFQTAGSVGDINHKHAVLTKSNTRPRFEMLPMYSNSDLYFVTSNEPQNSNTGQISSIIKRSLQGKEEVIYTFPENSDVQEFTLNKNETLMLGVVNQRPFLIDIASKSLEFLNLKSPIVKHLRFVDDELIQFSSEQVIQKSSIETARQASSNRQMAVYTYNLNNSTKTKIADGRLIYKSIILSDTNSGNLNRLTAHLAITEDFKATLTIKELNIERELGRLDRHCIRCYQIIKNDFYYIGRQSQSESASILYKVNMLTGEQATMSLPDTFHRGEFLKQFSINPNTNDLALVQRQNLKTDLTQLTGMQQIF